MDHVRTGGENRGGFEEPSESSLFKVKEGMALGLQKESFKINLLNI